jgi:hypothetical protein
VLLQSLEDIGQQLALELNDILGAIDKAEFDVERVVLGEMAAGCMGLGSIDVTSFKNSFKTGDAVFFVELRALRQIRDAIKVLQLEEIGATLSS